VGLVFGILAWILQLYVIVLIAYALTSWFPVHPDTTFEKVVRALRAVNEPILRPIRRRLPPLNVGGMAVDLSVLVVVLVAEVLVVVFRG
jgi:YggT family protein